MQTLQTVRPGASVRVVKLHGDGDAQKRVLKQRLMGMGITRGAEIFVRRVAPLGDPVEVRVRGYELSLRKEDTGIIEIEEIEEIR
jgi:ferrous iron transport protein A